MSSNKSGTLATIRDCQYCCPTASPPPIWSTGSGRQDLIERYVRPAVSGESFIGWVYSEKADPFSFNTTVHKVSGGYEINGEKLAVTGALGDGAFVVYGVNEEKNDLIAVIVERDDSALEITPIQTMGLCSMGVGRISLGHKFPMSY